MVDFFPVTWALRRLIWILILVKFGVAATTSYPNIVLITVDTTRADRMGFLGSKKGLTPNLDALAKDGVVFSRAYSQVPLTVPSHTSILTGTYPQYHGVDDFGLPLSKELPYLPQVLHEHGYKTAAFVGSVVLDPKSGWAPGIDRGFDHYDAGFSADPSQPGERRADAVVTPALEWLKTHPRGPVFVWVHIFDPHIPYDPPEPFKSRYASDPYDGEIAYADSVLGKVFEFLRAHSLYDNTLIAMMADHGEAFGEHGERTHGIFLYDETIHVPLLFKLPSARFAKKQIQTRARLVDVAPTILGIIGIPAPKTMQGESLLPLMEDGEATGSGSGKAQDRQAYSETDYPHRDFGWSSLRALRSDKYLFVEAPRPELYDQTVDPKAERNLAPTSTGVAQILAEKLDTFRRETAGTNQPGTAEVDPQLVQRLAALGYAAGGSARKNAGSAISGADPKDNIEIANVVQEALMASQNQRPQDAVSALEQLRAKNPKANEIEVVNRTLASALLQQEDFDKAIPVLRKAIALDPDFSLDHFKLGQALLSTGDVAGAKQEVEAAIKVSSLVNLKYAATLHFYLAAIERKMGDEEDALRELRVALQLDPDDYDSNLTLGRLLSMDGKAADGLPYLKKAAALQPEAREPHAFLADAYTQLGQEKEAIREHLEASRLH